MKLLYIIPLVLAVLLFILVWVLKNKNHRERSIRTLRIIGILSCCLAVVAIFLSYYFSGDKTQLFKLALPASIFMLLIVQIKQKN